MHAFTDEDTMNKLTEKCSASNRGANVLLVDEDPEYVESIRRIIQRCGYTVRACNSYSEGIRQLKSGAFDIIIVGQGSRHFEGRRVLESALSFNPALPVIVVARTVEMVCYLEAMQLGAVDYISPGLFGSEVASVLQSYAPHSRRRSRSIEPERAAASFISARLPA